MSDSPVTDNPVLGALEAYRRTHPRHADAVDAAMAAGVEDDPSPVEAEVACCECGQPVDPRGHDVLHEITGWSRHRDQGGQNHVRFRKETGRLMCPRCATALKYAGHTLQESLV